MRKVFALFAGLVLVSMLAACSDDSTPTPPVRHTSELSITTTAVPAGCTCNPYTQTLAASGGTAPYTWTLADGSDPLPTGLVLTTDGRISGVVSSTGDFSFTVRCTDSSPTPETADKAFTMNVTVPSNPSLAIFYDNGATVCSSGTQAFTKIDCYVFIMLSGSDVYCSQAAEFKLRLTDANNVDLEPGTQYYVDGESNPDYVTLKDGDLFDGISVVFSRPVYGPEPILVATFGLVLQEDLTDLSFKVVPDPTSAYGPTLAITSCEEGYPMYDVSGRVTALNY